MSSILSSEKFRDQHSEELYSEVIPYTAFQKRVMSCHKKSKPLMGEMDAILVTYNGSEMSVALHAKMWFELMSRRVRFTGDLAGFMRERNLQEMSCTQIQEEKWWSEKVGKHVHSEVIVITDMAVVLLPPSMFLHILRSPKGAKGRRFDPVSIGGWLAGTNFKAKDAAKVAQGISFQEEGITHFKSAWRDIFKDAPDTLIVPVKCFSETRMMAMKTSLAKMLVSSVKHGDNAISEVRKYELVYALDRVMSSHFGMYKDDVNRYNAIIQFPAEFDWDADITLMSPARVYDALERLKIGFKRPPMKASEYMRTL